jgi:peptide/nickel transport system permease protein
MSASTTEITSTTDTGSTTATRSAGPWRSAWQHVRKDRVAMASLAVLALIVLVCIAAPLYASRIAHLDPFTSNVEGKITINGQTQPVLAPSTEGLGLGVNPIGPTWNFTTYMLGADNQGRDVFARVLYGGRNTLIIGFGSAVICCLVAGLVGIVSGYFGKSVDAVLSRAMDVLWAFPVYLLAICLSIVLINTTITVGPVTVGSGSILLPILIIGIVFVPYVARPIRGQVLSLREREFVQAAVGAGASNSRLLRREILPNVLPTLIVFLPLMTAINMLTESALSFLGIGVQPPDASWGTIINDGVGLLYTRPMVAIAPGIMLAITAVALNLLGDGVRDALDPKARLRGSI